MQRIGGLMKSKGLKISFLFLTSASSALILAGCKVVRGDAAAEAPPPATVVSGVDVGLLTVDHPDQFPLVPAVEHAAPAQLQATGVVSPDVSRNVPVISIATGRVVEVHARLGDTVKKGQLLLRVQSADMSGAFSDYRKAVADETLARTQLERARDLHDHGAMSLNDLQVAQDAADKAKVDVENTRERIRVLGASVDHPAAFVDILAPVSGVITDQQVTAGAGVAGLGSPNPFTISDLSNVWVICDVYENDLANVHVGETAEIRLNAYPGKVLTGRISNVLPILDPALRTAKVRIEMRNPGMMRIGMFVTATFRGQKNETRTEVPASAILRLHDRDWVFVPAPERKFRRVEIVSGESLLNNMQEIQSGLQPGQQVVTNALALQNTVDE
jgi:membrane fusion protein, heavy metal efflux system